MSVSNFGELRAHVGHKIVCVIYGEENVALECEDCGEVLVSFDAEEEATMKPLPDYGDNMTFDEFSDNVQDGGIMDDDGFGYYSTATEISNILVDLWDFEGVDGHEPDKRFTHVCWFNK